MESKILQLSKQAAEKEFLETERKTLAQIKSTFGEELVDEFTIEGHQAKIKNTDYRLSIGIGGGFCLMHNDLKRYPNRFSTQGISKLSDIWEQMSRLETYNLKK